MVDAEPIIVTFQAETMDLVAGAQQGTVALQNFGKSAEVANFSILKAQGSSRGLFMAFMEMRVAMMSAENVMKRFGMSTAEVNALMGTANTIMDVAITIMAIYRAAHVSLALARWISAKAGMADAVATASIATGGVTIPVWTGVGLASMSALEAFSVALASGGIVTRPTRALIGESGPEAVIPLNRAGGMGGVNVTMNVYSNDPDMISRELGRRIQQLANAGALP